MVRLIGCRTLDWLGLLGLGIVGCFAAALATADPATSAVPGAQVNEQSQPAEQRALGRLGSTTEPRIDDLAEQTTELREQIAAQSELLRRLVAELESQRSTASSQGAAPGSAAADSAAAVEAPEEADPLADCKLNAAELSARLQQQALTLSEAQRRAEKAEKASSALTEAQARAATEIERLTAELATARARHAEALQQTVELERRLAIAEARLANSAASAPAVSTAAPAVAAPVVADPTATAPVIAAPTAAEAAESGAASTAAAVAASASSVSGATGPAATGQGEHSGMLDSPTVDVPPQQRTLVPSTGTTAAPVLYQVREADTLSRISERVYGDASAWERIYQANRDLLATPESLSPGMSLVIP
jgi:nucleoid-associated protein YgaU